MKVIEAKNVHKIYKEAEIEVHAVRGISVSFEEGEFAAIVGPSGSGKTTFLNILGGLDQPSEGEITIGGTNLSKLSPSKLIHSRPHL